MRQLITGLVPGLPAEVGAKILAQAEGVPLYAVETVRMLIDRGLLVAEGSSYRPVGAIGALDVPETLHALISARLDGLSPAERRLLQDAAVIGKSFSKESLAVLTGLTEARRAAQLARAQGGPVVQSDPRSPERGQYGFLQDLVRTVAYETLPRKDRKAMHLSVAEFLQRAWGADEPEVVEVVASHFLEAHRLAPDADARAPDPRARLRHADPCRRTRSIACGAGGSSSVLRTCSGAEHQADRACGAAGARRPDGNPTRTPGAGNRAPDRSEAALRRV